MLREEQRVKDDVPYVILGRRPTSARKTSRGWRWAANEGVTPHGVRVAGLGPIGAVCPSRARFPATVVESDSPDERLRSRSPDLGTSSSKDENSAGAMPSATSTTTPTERRHVLVLLVGEGTLLLDTLAHALTERGFDVASTGGTSTRTARDADSAVLILVEPGPQDWEAAQLVDAPVLVIGAEALDDTLEAAKAHGADLVVGPQASLQDLDDAIRAAASGVLVIDGSEHLVPIAPQDLPRLPAHDDRHT